MLKQELKRTSGQTLAEALKEERLRCLNLKTEDRNTTSGWVLMVKTNEGDISLITKGSLKKPSQASLKAEKIIVRETSDNRTIVMDILN